MLELVTGHTGSNHVTTIDEASKNMGLVGTLEYIFNMSIGYNMRPNMAGDTLEIYDGEAMMQGIHFRIPSGDVETIQLDPGAEGVNRKDAVIAVFSRAVSGVESIAWEVVKGTPSATTPSAPSVERGNLRSGSSTIRGVFFYVTFTGTIPTVERAVPLVRSLAGSSAFDITKSGDIAVPAGEMRAITISGIDPLCRYFVNFGFNVTTAGQALTTGVVNVVGAYNGNGSDTAFFYNSNTAGGAATGAFNNGTSLTYYIYNNTNVAVTVDFRFVAVQL